MNAPITQEQAAKLLALHDSPVVREAIAELERERAAQRAAILAAAEGKQAAALAEAARLGQLETEARAAQEAAQAAYLDALGKANALSIARSQADLAGQLARNRAQRDLHELGGQAIDHALYQLAFAESDARNRVGFVPSVNLVTGKQVGAEPSDRQAVALLDRIRDLRGELEELRFSHLSPAEIEQRCRAAVVEAQGQSAATKQRGTLYLSPPGFP